MNKLVDTQVIHPIHFAPRSNKERKQGYESNKLAKRLRRLVGAAIADFNMIEAGDRVMVCLSGGKDSYAMLDVLMRLREKAPVAFELFAVNLDQRHPGYPEHILPAYLDGLGVPYRIEVQDKAKRVVLSGNVDINQSDLRMQAALGQPTKSHLVREARKRGYIFPGETPFSISNR